MKRKYKYDEAVQVLEYALKEQKTITISKLKRLMRDINMTIQPRETVANTYLKNEIRKLINKNKQLEKQNRRLRKRVEQIEK